jgi:hypothetical protein
VSNLAVQSAGSRLEKFASSSGRWLGWVIVAAAGFFVFFAVSHDGVRDLRGIYFAIAGALVSWVVLIRPVAGANANGVLLQNMVHDIFVPWSKITRCRVFQTLQVVTDDAHFHGLGVSRSTRKLVQNNFGRSSLVSGWLNPTMQGGGRNAPIEIRGLSTDLPKTPAGAGSVYEDYVEGRITDLANGAAPNDLDPVVSWAWQAVGALVAALVLLVLVFV